MRGQQPVVPSGLDAGETNASTQFKDAACASLKAGDSVEVKGCAADR
jgi:hypothetical protein